MRGDVIRGLCAVACALAFHAALVFGAASFGWMSPDATALPELDLTSVELSFSETPDETAAPVSSPPPSPAVEPTPPPPPQPTVDIPPPPPVIESMQLPPPPTVEPPPPQMRHAEIPNPPEPTIPEPQPEPAVAAPPTPSAPAPSQARVTVDKPPSPRRRIRPEYPKGARQRGEEGDVTLELGVTAEGTVDDVRIVASCGFAELEQAAIQSVKRARFSPARRGTENVPSTARITLTFRLKD